MFCEIQSTVYTAHSSQQQHSIRVRTLMHDMVVQSAVFFNCCCLLSQCTYRDWKLHGNYNRNEIWHKLKTGVCRLVPTVVHLLVTLLSNQTNSNAYLVSILDIGLNGTSNNGLSRNWAFLQNFQIYRPPSLTCSFNVR